MEIYKDKFRKVTFEHETKIIYQEWYRASENMTEAEYKEAAVSIPKLVKEHGANKVITDAINSLFIVTPEIQDWFNKNVVPEYLKAGVEKFAILLPIEIFTQVSVEQIVEDTDNLAQKRIQYFKNEADARKWLAE